MQTLRTFYRAVVMLMTLAIGVMGWKLYGPSSKEMHSLVQRFVKMADSMLNTQGETPIESPIARPIVSQELPPFVSASSDPPVEPLTVPGKDILPRPLGDEALLQAIYVELEKLGAGGTSLEPWGSRGNLYRFCCHAALPGHPGMNRHFESVATEPLTAAEQVVEEVKAWQMARRDSAMAK